MDEQKRRSRQACSCFGSSSPGCSPPMAGRGGYLAQAGLVPASDEVRTRKAEAARSLPALSVSTLHR